MNAAREADTWIGKTLFIPIIIRVCQATRQSQYATSKTLWFAACLHALYFSTGGVGSIMLIVLCAGYLLYAGLAADRPNQSQFWFRALMWLNLIIEALRGTNSDNWNGLVWTLIVLFAEYAATITHVPPRERRAGLSRLAEERR